MAHHSLIHAPFGAPWITVDHTFTLHTLPRLHIHMFNCAHVGSACEYACRTMPYIYATLLPNDVVKIGYCTDERTRPFAAQTYYAETVELLALWEVTDGRDEQRAHCACREWRVRGELFRVLGGWLEATHPVIVAVSGLLGEPLPSSAMPKRPAMRPTIARRWPWAARRASSGRPPKGDPNA